MKKDKKALQEHGDKAQDVKKGDTSAKRGFFMNAFSQILGYTFVGIFALVYGFFKQWSDRNGGSVFFGVASLPLVFNVFVTTFFGYIYAKVYFFDSDIQDVKDLYEKFKKWIVGVLKFLGIIIVSVWGVFSYKQNCFSGLFIIENVICSLPGIIMLIFAIRYYDDFLKSQSDNDYTKEIIEQDQEKEKEQHDSCEGEDKRLEKKRTRQNMVRRTRYMLVIPALLVISTNIFVGTSYRTFFEKMLGRTTDLTYIITYIALNVLLFSFLWCLYGVGTGKVSTRYCIFFPILAVIGILGIVINEDYPDISVLLLNFFLAIMTSVFLSIFESWYTYCNVYEHGRVTEAQRRIVKAISFIVAILPAVIYGVYPLQVFNYIYPFVVCVGIFVIDIVWFTKMLPIHEELIEIGEKKSTSEETKNEFDKKMKDFESKIGKDRAALGFITFVFLIVDQASPIFMRMKIGEWLKTFVFKFPKAIEKITRLGELLVGHSNKANLANIETLNQDSFVEVVDGIVNALNANNKDNMFAMIINIMITTALFACLTTALSKYSSLKEVFKQEMVMPIIVRIAAYSVAFVVLLLYGASGFDGLGDSAKIKYIISTFFLVLFIVFDLMWALYMFFKQKDSNSSRESDKKDGKMDFQNAEECAKLAEVTDWLIVYGIRKNNTQATDQREKINNNCCENKVDSASVS